MAREDLQGLFKRYEEYNKHLRELNFKLRDNGIEQRQIFDEAQRTVETAEASSKEEERAALLRIVDGRLERVKQLGEEFSLLQQEYENTQAEVDALKGSVDENMAHVHTAAIETERLLFEIGKLVATLSIGTIVAISAVTPALLPNLNDLGSLWPAFGWIFTAIVASVLLCMYAMSNISQLLAQLATRKSWLPLWASRVVGATPYAFLLTFSVGALLIGIGGFVLFVSRNMS